MSRLVVNIIGLTVSWCSCHGWLHQLDATLPNGQRLRVMRSSRGYHVQVGTLSKLPPPPIPGAKVLDEIKRQAGLS